MELKNYQKKVINNLSNYLSKIDESNLITGWNNYWKSLQVKEFLSYNNDIKNVPKICLKVPTGGGKTFLASCSLKPIFNTIKLDTKLVVWLVPSDSIREQTITALTNPNHPYRGKINVDFAGRVEVFTKEMILHGQNFSPESIKDQLSICIISYNSLRIDKNKAESRKVFQENGYLKSFADLKKESNNDLVEYPDTALINILRYFNPVVIIDESHNATSDLSIEMINNLNPSFILELTATPKSTSNIISYVSANELKSENMVKLPVIVYKRNTVKDVYLDAIQLQRNLELKAQEEEKKTGVYIRPIVLFQAESNTNDTKETYDKLKQKLIDFGIPASNIAIKVSGYDELHNKDLLSKDCQIRYIITVNALKEGWDCPFAYILASLADKKSKTDVEQIVGRILRQPYTKKCIDNLLNTSYILTCAAEFNSTLDNVVKGLNNAGFSKKDYRVANYPKIENNVNDNIEIDNVQNSNQTFDFSDDETKNNDLFEFTNLKPDEVRQVFSSIQEGSFYNKDFNSSIIEPAIEKTKEYNNDFELSKESGIDTSEMGDMMQQITINKQFLDEIEELHLPQFMLKNTAMDMFGNEFELLEKNDLLDGFSLASEDAKILFSRATAEMYEIDTNLDSSNDDFTPKYKKLSAAQSETLRTYFDSMANNDEKRNACAKEITAIINKNNHLSNQDVVNYVNRVIANMDSDTLDLLPTMYIPFAQRIKEYIVKLEDSYREKKFYELANGIDLKSKESYSLKKVINPINSIDSIPFSLYTAEADDMNPTEKSLINSIIATNNVKWWHRIIERNDFYINGAIHHYPDFIVRTLNGTIVLIESKGDDRDNEDSKRKLALGKKWEAKSGADNYKYFMVFDKKEQEIEGSFSTEKFLEIFKQL